MKKQLLGMAIGLSLALGAGGVAADGVGPYYATPAWDQQLPSATRFLALANWGDQAVLDRETGLVWQTSLVSTANDFIGATRACSESAAGGRGGWRLPTLQELTRTLVADGNGDLVTGTPFAFLGKGKLLFWSSTGSFDALQWSVVVSDPFSSRQVVIGQGEASGMEAAWCVQSPAAGAAIQ